MNIFSFLILKSKTKYLDGFSSVRQALEKMDYYKFSVVPLLDGEGRYLGTVSEGDLLSCIKNDCNFDLKKMEERMVLDIPRYRSYKALNVSASIEELISLALEQNFIPVVDDRDMFIGIIPRKTLIDHYYEQIKDSFSSK